MIKIQYTKQFTSGLLEGLRATSTINIDEDLGSSFIKVGDRGRNIGTDSEYVIIMRKQLPEEIDETKLNEARRILLEAIDEFIFDSAELADSPAVVMLIDKLRAIRRLALKAKTLSVMSDLTMAAEMNSIKAMIINQLEG